MRIRETQVEEETGLNMTPLIDMVFLLLIFFLVATTFAQEERELEVQLPATAAQPQPLSAPPPQLIINVLADGTVRVDRQDYDRKALGELLAKVARNEPGREVLIRADEMGPFKHFAGVAGLCHEVGIAASKIGYLPAEGAGR